MISNTQAAILAIFLIAITLMTLRAIYGLFAWPGRRKKALIQVFGFPIAGFILLLIVAAVLPTSSPEAVAESSEREAARAARDEDRAKQEANEVARLAEVERLREPPKAQKALLDAIVAGRTAYDSAANDMAKGGSRAQRAEAICSALQRPVVSGWIGQIETLSSNSEGRGVLAIEIGEDVILGTWNNVISDASSDTLIDPSSNLFQAASALSVGTWVRFAGSFIPDATDCFEEKSITMNGAMMDPEFVFRFSGIQKVAGLE